MAVITPPGYQQSGTYDAVKDRQYHTTMEHYKNFFDNSAARSGLLPDTPAWSAPQSTSLFVMTVGPFRAIISNTFAANAGDYKVVSPSSTNVTFAGSSTTTNRIDIVGVQVRDAFYSGAISDAQVVVIPGTPSAGTPAAPTLPNAFMALWQATINANVTTPTIVDLRKRTAPIGACVPIFPAQLSESGCHFGEERIAPASGAMPARKMYWGEDGRWHGINPYVLRFPNVATGSTSVAKLLSTLAVADPGYPYNVFMSGNVWGQNSGGNGWWVRTYVGPNTGGVSLGGAGIDENNIGHSSLVVSGSTTTPLTGAASLQIWTENPFGGGSVNITSESQISCQIVPA